MSIHLCPKCERGLMPDETHCPACGTSLQSGEAQQVWLKQIKVYIACIIVGIGLLAYSLPALMERTHHGLPAEQSMVIIAIIGGLAGMGGGFGLLLAVFFYYLWKNKLKQ